MMASGEIRLSAMTMRRMPVLAQSQNTSNQNGGSLAFVGPAAVAATDTTLATIVVTAAATAVGALLPDWTSPNDTFNDPTGFVFHFTTNANMLKIQASGAILPGTSSGVVWVTPTPYVNASTAQSMLALPTTPDGYYIIPAQNLQTPLSWTMVQPNYGYPGGGIEGTTPAPIPIGGATWVPLN